MSIIHEELAGKGVVRTESEVKSHTLKCLSSDCEIDKKMLQHDRDLTIITILEDRVRATVRELDRKKTGAGSTAHVSVVNGCGGPGSHGVVPTPGHQR